MSMISRDGWLQLWATGETDYHQYVLGAKIESIRLERQDGSNLYALKVYANSREYTYNDGLVESEGLVMLNELKAEVSQLV